MNNVLRYVSSSLADQQKAARGEKQLRKHPILNPEWQAEEYTLLMGHPPPNDLPEEFSYNPRTKAGKDLFKRIVYESGL